jgi:AraC family transcriptional regulator
VRTVFVMAGLTKPQDWQFSQPPDLTTHRSGWSGALVRHWRRTARHTEQPPLDHHYVALHLGGPKYIRRSRDGRGIAVAVPVGALSMVPAGTAFSWRTEGPIDFAHLYVAPDVLAGVAREELDRDSRQLSLCDHVGISDPLLGALFCRMLVGLERSGGEHLFLDCLLRTFTMQLLHEHSTLSASVRAPKYALAPARLRQVIDFMETHLAENLTLADLARVANRSPYHFCRAFRQATGRPPYRYLIHRRIERAKAILVESDVPLTEVAREVGFHSQRQFAAMFTSVLGVSPGRFRQLEGNSS